MNWWGALIGGWLGAALGGPLGALLGAVLGAKLGGFTGAGVRVEGSTWAEGSTRAEGSADAGTQGVQAAFFTALFACLGKLAKADGQVTREEVSLIESFMRDRLNLNKNQRDLAASIFNRAKDDGVPFEAYAAQLGQALKGQYGALLFFYELLFELAMADGVLNPEEDRLLAATPGILGLNPAEYARLRAELVEGLQDPYQVLGVSRDDSFKDIRTAYYRLRRQAHPDTLIAKGVPDEMVREAQQRFILIQEAYEKIERERRP